MYEKRWNLGKSASTAIEKDRAAATISQSLPEHFKRSRERTSINTLPKKFSRGSFFSYGW
jgi:hypothetical protein